MQKDGYSLLLPTGTLDYFDVVNVHEDSTQIVIYLEEKNIVPSEYSGKDTERVRRPPCRKPQRSCRR